MPRPSSVPIKTDYAVQAQERFAALVPEWQMVGPDDRLEYVWDHGAERVIIHNDVLNNGSDYRGAYHPNVHCETGTADGVGVCNWCGRTCW